MLRGKESKLPIGGGKESKVPQEYTPLFIAEDKWQGLAFGARSEVRKTLHTENKLKTKIKDGQNATNIGVGNVFRGNQLRFSISAQ